LLAWVVMLLMVPAGCKKKSSAPDPGPAPTGINDIDGNMYHKVTIGTQVWMVENLKVTHYRNGDPITNITDATQWSNSVLEGGWCNYGNIAANGTTYGRLYNWIAVDDSRQLAPEGWHIPNLTEWITLQNTLSTNIGGKLKETGTLHWLSPNTGATDESGFTALPGGDRHMTDGSFNDLGVNGTWWSTTKNNILPLAYYWSLSNTTTDFNFAYEAWKTGLSVRCIQD
jgi:uncharacterized protein (TIGR02145 family)